MVADAREALAVQSDVTLAAELGFADHSHLCPVVQAETCRTPAELRQALGPAV